MLALKLTNERREMWGDSPLWEVFMEMHRQLAVDLLKISESMEIDKATGEDLDRLAVRYGVNIVRTPGAIFYTDCI